MAIPFLGFSTAFIFLALLIMIYRKKGRPLDKDDKQYVIISLVVAIALSVIFGIFPILDYYNYPPPNLLPALTIMLYILIICLCTIGGTKILLHYKSPIEKSINNHYHERLLKEIGLELEKELIIKNIALDNQWKAEILNDLAKRVSDDIIKGRILQKGQISSTYDVYNVPDEGCMKLGGIIFTITKDSAEILAKKMTELYNNRKYRKRLYRYFSLLI
jgi:hypothetical protein